MRASLEEVDPGLEHAARGLGARPHQVLLRVTLPLVGPGVLAGALLAAIVSLNELLMAVFLGTPAVETLPKVVWPNLRYTLSPVVAAASGVSLALAVVGLVGAYALGVLLRGAQTSP